MKWGRRVVRRSICLTVREGFLISTRLVFFCFLEWRGFSTRFERVYIKSAENIAPQPMIDKIPLLK